MWAKLDPWQVPSAFVDFEDNEESELNIVLNKGAIVFDPQALIIGDASTVAEQFQAFEKLGYTDIIVRNLHPDPACAIASTDRLKQVKVMVDNFF